VDDDVGAGRNAFVQIVGHSVDTQHERHAFSHAKLARHDVLDIAKGLCVNPVGDAAMPQGYGAHKFYAQQK